MIGILAGIATGGLLHALLLIQGRRNCHSILWSRTPYRPSLWKRFTATYFLYCNGYKWKESWIRMKYSPNYI